MTRGAPPEKGEAPREQSRGQKSKESTPVLGFLGIPDDNAHESVLARIGLSGGQARVRKIEGAWCTGWRELPPTVSLARIDRCSCRSPDISRAGSFRVRITLAEFSERIGAAGDRYKL
jgi:hypothetical protein